MSQQGGHSIDLQSLFNHRYDTFLVLKLRVEKLIKKSEMRNFLTGFYNRFWNI